jgi:hypothetical protein
LFAVVKKELFTFFHCRFTVNVPGPDDLEAKGDLTGHEYEFWRQSGLRATVSKQWFAWSDTYGVEIAEEEDDILTNPFPNQIKRQGSFPSRCNSSRKTMSAWSCERPAARLAARR